VAFALCLSVMMSSPRFAVAQTKMSPAAFTSMSGPKRPSIELVAGTSFAHTRVPVGVVLLAW
jgi:hypothetical protein